MKRYTQEHQDTLRFSYGRLGYVHIARLQVRMRRQKLLRFKWIVHVSNG